MVRFLTLTFLIFFSSACAEEEQEVQSPRPVAEYYKEVVSWDENESDYTIDVPTFLGWIEDDNTVVIDVRGCCNAEMIKPSIALSSANIDEHSLKQTIPNKDTRIITICAWNVPITKKKRVLTRTAIFPLNSHARNIMKSLGYKNVYKLENYNVSEKKGTARLIPYTKEYKRK